MSICEQKKREAARPAPRLHEYFCKEETGIFLFVQILICRRGQARSEYSMNSVWTQMSSSAPMKGGTISRTPLSRIAGL